MSPAHQMRAADNISFSSAVRFFSEGTGGIEIIELFQTERLRLHDFLIARQITVQFVFHFHGSFSSNILTSDRIDAIMIKQIFD